MCVYGKYILTSTLPPVCFFSGLSTAFFIKKCGTTVSGGTSRALATLELV